MTTNKMNIFWFRRDLRTEDNAGLFHALNAGFPVLPVFIFDTEILDKLEKKDARVLLIYQLIKKLKDNCEENGSSMYVFHGKPLDAFQMIFSEYQVNAVYTNRDYEPYAIKRDTQIRDFLFSKGIQFYDFKDQVIFDHNDILKENEEPYTVFTPYSRKWKTVLSEKSATEYPSHEYLQNCIKTEPFVIPSLSEIGFQSGNIRIPDFDISKEKLEKYAAHRDFPAENGTSRLSFHLRFGTVSIRKITRLAFETSETFLNELIWRNFYMDILCHFPHVEERSFKPDYDRIEWRNDENEFTKWCEGKTGYPLVDAGMRELNTTGFMHNRVRMVTASFLCKHLLIDWRWGEAYFAEKLIDYDLAANNGGWQWAAGSGCDAAPYFRVFNPSLQAVKFDPQYKYIKKWLPEYGTNDYTEPIVEHSFARNRAVETYKRYLKSV